MVLFEGDPKPKKTRAETGVQSCIDRFYNLFVKKFNHGVDIATAPKGSLATPIIKGGKHGKQFKELLATWDQATVEAVIDLFFYTKDPMIVRSDYTLDFFFMKAQYLRLAIVRRRPQMDDRQMSNIDAARRATGRDE